MVKQIATECLGNNYLLGVFVLHGICLFVCVLATSRKNY